MNHTVFSAGAAAAGAATTLRVSTKEWTAEDVLVMELESIRGLRLPDWAPGAHIDLVLPNGMTRQ